MRNAKSTIKEVSVDATPDILTVKQLSEVTGTSINAIYSMTKQRSKRTNEAYLDICYPFPDSLDSINTGPVFIVRNKKTEDYIKKSLKRRGKGPASKSQVKPKHSQIKKEQVDFSYAIEKLFIEYLGRAVQFDAKTTALANKAKKEYGTEAIIRAVRNIEASAHSKNDYKLITLNYFFRELDRWSKLNEDG